MNVDTGVTSGAADFFLKEYARDMSGAATLQFPAAAPGLAADGMGILGIAWGGPTMIMGFSESVSAAGTVRVNNLATFD
ncbi:MAG: hypothetical protein HYY17_09675 [Planctomycetes bacterium]|nr:hypothetical protein [Planctomycetota bacterium]